MNTALEEYLCTSLAFTLLALTIVTVLLTGTIPLSSSLSECTAIHAERNHAGCRADESTQPRSQQTRRIQKLPMPFHQ